MLAFLAALALAAADPADAGPWRQLIRFQPSPDYPDGSSLWISEDALLAPDAPATREVRAVRELWVAQGAIVGGQAYTVKSTRYDCAEGSIFTDQVQVFTRDGRLLGQTGPAAEPDYVQTHSAEAEIERALCTHSRLARQGAMAATVAEAVAQAGPEREVGASDAVQFDVDYDGQPDTIRIAMRPHSMRHDVEIVLANQANRAINVVVAEQPPTGPLVQRLIRPLERDRYLIACEMKEGEDVAPCRPDYVLTQRGVEVVAPGHPTILVWLTEGEPHVARLPVAPE